MGSAANQESAIKQFQSLMDEVDESLKSVYEIVHQGYPKETLVRFLKARDWNVNKAHKMLIDSLEWRLQNEINNILTKPIVPADLYRAVRDTQLVGLSGFTRDGHPVIAVGVGLSTYDKASPYATKKYGRYIGTCVKILDMTGLRLSALNQIKLLTAISTIDDLNYPEKTDTYYIVNPPRVFSACWRVVKPLLQERTRMKVQVLYGCPRDELLKVSENLMMFNTWLSVTLIYRREGSGSSRGSDNGTVDDCFSLDHDFHQQLYNYIKQQALLVDSSPVKRGSVHVSFPKPEPEDIKITRAIESEFHRLGDHRNRLASMMSRLKVNGSWKRLL